MNWPWYGMPVPQGRGLGYCATVLLFLRPILFSWKAEWKRKRKRQGRGYCVHCCPNAASGTGWGQEFGISSSSPVWMTRTPVLGLPSTDHSLRHLSRELEEKQSFEAQINTLVCTAGVACGSITWCATMHPHRFVYLWLRRKRAWFILTHPFC